MLRALHADPRAHRSATKVNVLAGSLTLLDRKRLELARALATDPKVLLLDEIAGGLTEAEVRDPDRDHQGPPPEGITIIWIEHIVHALLAVVDRIMVISFGRKLIEGEPHDGHEQRPRSRPATWEGRRHEPSRDRRRRASTTGISRPSSISLQGRRRRDVRRHRRQRRRQVHDARRWPACQPPGAADCSSTASPSTRCPPTSAWTSASPRARRPPGVPQPDGAGEPDHRRVPEGRKGPGPSTRSRAVPAAQPLASGRPRCSPGASSRLSLSGGRSWPTRASSSWTKSRWAWRRWSSSASTRHSRSASTNGTTILVVEQDVQHVLTVAEPRSMLPRGRIALAGRPRELTNEQITAAYFGV